MIFTSRLIYSDDVKCITKTKQNKHNTKKQNAVFLPRNFTSGFASSRIFTIPFIYEYHTIITPLPPPPPPFPIDSLNSINGCKLENERTFNISCRSGRCTFKKKINLI